MCVCSFTVCEKNMEDSVDEMENLVSLSLARSAAEEEEEEEEEGDEKEEGKKKEDMVVVHEEKEDRDSEKIEEEGGSILNSLIANLPVSISDGTSAPEADEASLLINSVVHG